MTKLTRIASACLALVALSAQPAFAARTNSNAATATQEMSRFGTQVQPKEARYCLSVTPDTGSRVSRKVCRTKAEWAEEGVELKS